MKHFIFVFLSIFFFGCVSSEPEVKPVALDQNIIGPMIVGSWKVDILIVNGQASAPSGRSGLFIFKRDHSLEIRNDEATLLHGIMRRGYSQDEARVLLKESERKQEDPFENITLKYTVSSGSLLSVDVLDKMGNYKGKVLCKIALKNSNLLGMGEFKVSEELESDYPDIKKISLILSRK